MVCIYHEKHHPQAIASRTLFPAVKLRNVLLAWRPQGLHADKTQMTYQWKTWIHTPGAWQQVCNVSHTTFLFLVTHQKKRLSTYTGNIYSKKAKREAASLPKIFRGWNKQYSEDCPIKSKTGLLSPIEKKVLMSLHLGVCEGMNYMKKKRLQVSKIILKILWISATFPFHKLSHWILLELGWDFFWHSFHPFQETGNARKYRQCDSLGCT